MSRLTGPARLLAMSWTHVNFDHSGGTKEYLRLLANSPLVRRSLPNAAAICQQYFSFRKAPGEAMRSFLVRESFGYSEFVEAIIRLYIRRSMELSNMRKTLVFLMILMISKMKLGGTGKNGKSLILPYITPKDNVLKEQNVLPKLVVLRKENKQQAVLLRVSISALMTSSDLSQLHLRGDPRLFNQVSPLRRFRSFPCRIALCLVCFEDSVFFRLQ